MSKKSTSSQPEIMLRINLGGGGSIHVQVERSLREAIRSGRLRLGTPLPSTRVLARDLGVSRGVIVEAYEQLIAEGYLAARAGSKTFVASGAPRISNQPGKPNVSPPKF